MLIAHHESDDEYLPDYMLVLHRPGLFGAEYVILEASGVILHTGSFGYVRMKWKKLTGQEIV